MWYHLDIITFITYDCDNAIWHYSIIHNSVLQVVSITFFNCRPHRSKVHPTKEMPRVVSASQASQGAPKAFAKSQSIVKRFTCDGDEAVTVGKIWRISICWLFSGCSWWFTSCSAWSEYFLGGDVSEDIEHICQKNKISMEKMMRNRWTIGWNGVFFPLNLRTGGKTLTPWPCHGDLGMVATKTGWSLGGKSKTSSVRRFSS